jgi:2-keto-4-pentenoate hydratase/2-oxohepta-3-ene-1,7-dioic acid hydratase in catechol pathway
MTGTPAGVGPLVEGDAVAADIAGVAHLELKVVGRD